MLYRIRWGFGVNIHCHLVYLVIIYPLDLNMLASRFLKWTKCTILVQSIRCGIQVIFLLEYDIMVTFFTDGGFGTPIYYCGVAIDMTTSDVAAWSYHSSLYMVTPSGMFMISARNSWIYALVGFRRKCPQVYAQWECVQVRRPLLLSCPWWINMGCL